VVRTALSAVWTKRPALRMRDCALAAFLLTGCAAAATVLVSLM